MTIGGIELDWQLTLIIILGTILPMLDWYGHSFFRGWTESPKPYDRVVLYFVIPVIVIWILFAEPLKNYGFQWGNWREGLLWVVGVCAVMAVILWFVARTPAMQAYYELRAPKELSRLLWRTAVDLFGWEFIWRGFMLFGLARVLGPGPAIFLQAVPFAFMHLNKPELETLTTIFGGAGFAFIAWRTESFVYPFFIHWFIASFTQMIASGRF